MQLSVHPSVCLACVGSEIERKQVKKTQIRCVSFPQL